MIKCNLKLLMAKKNITRKELSEETDIGLNSIGRYINNEFVKFDKEHMDSLCKYFDCSISDLITFENEDKAKDNFYIDINTLKKLTSSVDSEICYANNYIDDYNYLVMTEEEHNEYHQESKNPNELIRENIMKILFDSKYNNNKK